MSKKCTGIGLVAFGILCLFLMVFLPVIEFWFCPPEWHDFFNKLHATAFCMFLFGVGIVSINKGVDLTL